MSRTVPIGEASRILGLSTDAIRKRLKRKGIDGYRDNQGRWLIVLDSAQASPGQALDSGQPVVQPVLDSVLDSGAPVLDSVLDSRPGQDRAPESHQPPTGTPDMIPATVMWQAIERLQADHSASLAAIEQRHQAELARVDARHLAELQRVTAATDMVMRRVATVLTANRRRSWWARWLGAVLVAVMVF